MFRVFSVISVIGFLLGLAATPVFAQSSGQDGHAKEARIADAEALGTAFAGNDAQTEQSAEVVRQVSLDTDDSRSAGNVAADPNRARRVLGALLAGMGTLETKPSEGIGLPKTAR